MSHGVNRKYRGPSDRGSTGRSRSRWRPALIGVSLLSAVSISAGGAAIAGAAETVPLQVTMSNHSDHSARICVSPAADTGSKQCGDLEDAGVVGGSAPTVTFGYEPGTAVVLSVEKEDGTTTVSHQSSSDFGIMYVSYDGNTINCHSPTGSSAGREC